MILNYDELESIQTILEAANDIGVSPIGMDITLVDSNGDILGQILWNSTEGEYAFNYTRAAS